MPVRRSSSKYSRRRTYRRATGSGRVIPGSLRRVRRGGVRDQAIYAYGCAARKLMHFVPSQSYAATRVFFNSGNVFRPAAGGNLLLLNGIAQGTGIDQRQLDKVYMKTLTLRMWFQPGTEFTGTGSRGYPYLLLLVYDTQLRTGGGGTTPPTIADIVDNTYALANQRIDTRERFQILYRKVINANAFPYWNGTALAYSPYHPSADKMYQLKIPINRMTTYHQNGTDDSYESINRGSLILYCVSEFVAAESTNSHLSVVPRLSYIDYD